MRNFRTAAVAAATALTLGLTGTTVAGAQEDPDNTPTQTQGQNASLSSGLSAAITGGSSAAGNDQGAWEKNEDGDIVAPDVTGEDMFGDDVSDDLPAWAQNWKDVTTVASVGAVVGLIVAAVNAAKYVGLLPS